MFYEKNGPVKRTFRFRESNASFCMMRTFRFADYTLPLLAMVMQSSNFLTLPSLPMKPSTPLLSAVDDTYGIEPSVWSAFLRRLPR